MSGDEKIMKREWILVSRSILFLAVQRYQMRIRDISSS